MVEIRDNGFKHRITVLYDNSCIESLSLNGGVSCFKCETLWCGKLFKPFDEQPIAAECETSNRLPQKPTTRLTDNTESVEDNNIILNENIDLINNNKKENNIKEKRFKKPTIEEIQAYINEKSYHFDAETFFAFYESKGWKVGTSPMKKWQAACVTWERSYLQKHPNSKQHTHQCQNEDSVIIGGQTYK